MDRITREDAVVLWPDERWPQDIGAVLLLDGAPLLDPSGTLRIDAVRSAVAARLHLVPRLRQVLVVPGRGRGRPLWVDAPAFDVAEHVGVVPVTPPGDDAQLLRAVERLRRRRLDRERPLWEMWFLPGLSGGRVGVFVRLHHVLADGIAGVATMSAFLDGSSDAGTSVDAGDAAIPAWSPRPAPPDRHLRADARLDRLGRAARATASLAHPWTTIGRLRATLPALRELVADERVPRTSLDRVIGADRSLALLRARLELVEEIGHRHGATVNDVLLGLTAGGLRGLLDARGELADDLVVRVYVPVTLRARADRGHAAGNMIGQMVVPLPVGTADPVRRLERIAAESARRKARPRPSLGGLFASPLLAGLLLRLLRRNPVNVETADIPGPREPRHLAGARVLEAFPLLNLIGDVTVGVGALSYAGTFGVLAVADRDTCPDLAAFAAAAEDELRALAASVRGATPAGSRGDRRTAGPAAPG